MSAQNPNKKSLLLLILIIALLAVGVGSVRTQVARAAPPFQAPIFTPTPGPDGRIIYIVQPNDTLLSISILTGVPVDELRGLNNLTGDTIIEGQRLILGLAGPPEGGTPFTPGPTATPTPLLPTPSPPAGTAELCILLFDDLNGDSVHQEAEPAIPGGAISVSNRSGSVSETTATTNVLDPLPCFPPFPEGDYTISVAIPAGYNPTTTTSYELGLKAGDKTYLDFGAQINSETEAEAPTPTGSGKSPLLGILGGLLLLMGVGLAVFAGRLLKG